MTILHWVFVADIIVITICCVINGIAIIRAFDILEGEDKDE